MLSLSVTTKTELLLKSNGVETRVTLAEMSRVIPLKLIHKPVKEFLRKLVVSSVEGERTVARSAIYKISELLGQTREFLRND